MNTREFKNKLIEIINDKDYVIDYNDGLTVTINKNAPCAEYKVNITHNNISIYNTTIKPNEWAKLNKKYAMDGLSVTITGDKTETEDITFDNKNVCIILDSKALGDTLAWMPYAQEFKKKHNANVYLLTFHNDWFNQDEYDIEFINWDNINDVEYFATFRIGWYYKEDNKIDFDRNPNNFRTQPMQKTASDILGLEFREIKPILNINKKETIKGKVGIAIHSSSQVKYWNRENGWQEVVDYLNKGGHDVVLYSKEHDGYMGNYNPVGVTQFPVSDLLDVAEDLSSCEFFIGIPSGLSWLAWTMDVPVIMINGFTDPYTEFSDKLSVVDDYGQHCFNHSRLDPNDWNWCPCEPKFSCSSNITPDMVIEKIKQIYGINIVNDKVYISKSNVHGYGVFAKQNISKNEIIEVCPSTKLYDKDNPHYGVLNDYRFSYPSGTGENWTEHRTVFGYGSIYNHSNENNATWYTTDNGLYVFVAIKDIKAGEEICTFYGNDEFK